MDLEIVQALIVVSMVIAEGGLFYLLARKFWKASRQEATLMAIGLTLLFCAAVWLCKWGNEIRMEVLFWAGWLGLCWVWSVKKCFRSAKRSS
jgi:hypothetical protein